MLFNSFIELQTYMRGISRSICILEKAGSPERQQCVDAVKAMSKEQFEAICFLMVETDEKNVMDEIDWILEQGLALGLSDSEVGYVRSGAETEKCALYRWVYHK